MSALIRELTKELRPKGKDRQILANRKDTHFSQKVRNLKSHDTLTRKGLATYRDGVFRITARGRRFLEESQPLVDAMVLQGFSNEAITKEIEADFRGIVIEEGAATRVSRIQRERSRKLRFAAIKRFARAPDGRLYCQVCDFDFEKAYGQLGKGFIEIHHLSPIHLMMEKGEARELEEALKNVVPLCSNCHKMIHYRRSRPLTPEQLRRIYQGL